MRFLILTLLMPFLGLLQAQTIDSVAIKKQVDSLLKVSRALVDKHDFDKGLEVNAAAERLAIVNFGMISAAYGNCAYNKGRLFYYKFDYTEAEKWFLESKAILERAVGKEHPKYAWSLHNLGLLYKTIGNYEVAEPFYLEAMAIREKVLGKEHPDYASSMANLANLYIAVGNYEKAEPLYLESKAIREKVLGKDHPEYAKSLSNLAIFFYEMGNYEKAEPLYLESKAIREKVLGKEHPDYANSLSNLAVLYHDMGNYEKAESLYLEANAILGKVLGKEHPDYANSLNNLAVFYDDMGNYEKAEPLYLESKVIMEKVLGKDHPDYASSPNNLANLYYEMGKYERVESLHLEAKALRQKVLGKEHPDYTSSLTNLVRLYERQNRYLDSDPLNEEAFILSQTRLINSMSFLSEKELAKYILKFQNSSSELSAYLLARQAEKSQTGNLSALVYDHVLFYKGFLLTAASRQNTLSAASTESKEINVRLKVYQRQLATEYAKPIAERNDINELEEKANIAEKELARSVAGYADAIRQIKWKEVQATLKQTDAAMEFISFKVNFPLTTDSNLYAALLVKPGDKQPKFIPLFESKSLDSLLHSKSERKADYVNSLYTLAERGIVAEPGPKKSLYEILWKPLEKELTGIKTIYFSPSGLLHRINLDAIAISETETLADKYKLVELNSTRQLVIPRQIKNGNNDAVLYGGIQFEQDSTFQNNEPLIVSRSRGELSFSSIDSTLRGGSWNYLAGTEREVNSIEKIMETSGLKVILKTGYEATEESFKNIGVNNASSPRILHIATHGYFFPDPKGSRQSLVGGNHDEPVFKMSEHPMLRSGLIMAGGNASWQGKQTLEGREDGILTAYEISLMNLSNTELVVLSACETGLGDIQGNEGVYGLQRAFKIAGAKYLIMSLWQVPDKQTSILMTTFYKKWLEEKLNIPDAFHAAQKELRDLGLDPYQWAGFVLVE
ncbi:MAG: CHAT domain-containing protein [Saprospiraceae bacterium]|nr:CHAT domain-containing protein [Candidatus Defluviibacterium haderslevense]